ncbi:hypothetical protein J1N35_018909 [Gossypium stocksii]|uniref:Transposase MuDR plant domain-containing protein n=1 Tax=Gossypium stocksii TaxID=47602 RepID=A0A9D3VQY5_9ROSI|nr:hypothetical protein J1N35_018909 [Gossypium stocksii]
MVQTHLVSGSPYFELYVQFSLPNKAFVTSTSTTVREEYITLAQHYVSGWQNMEAPVFGSSMEYTTLAQHSIRGWDMHLGGSMFDARNTYWGMTSTSSGWQSTSDWGHYETSTRRDDVLLTTSSGEGTSYVTDDEHVPTEPKDVEGGSDEEKEDLRFRAYLPPAHMHNVDLSADDALEFPDLQHRRCDRTSSSLYWGELEVSKEFSNKDSFLGALKQHSITNGVNYNVVKSKSNKFEAKCAVQYGTCSWKIMASVRKKTGLWKRKKYKGPHTCVASTVSLGVYGF